jgi:hypothetical protein
MLEKISVPEVKHIAELANAVRTLRDHLLDKIRDEALAEPKPARGQHNPTAMLGLDPLEPHHPATQALREAIEALPGDARRELRALMSIGQGDYAAKDFARAVADTSAMPDDVIIGALMEQADLHGYLMKALYEMKLA